MQLDRKTLAFLQLPATKGDLYAPPSGSKGLVHHIVLHNTNTTAESVVLNYHNGTNEYEIFSQSIAAGATLIWDFKGAGDIVEDGGKYTGNTTTASKVTMKVMGTEEMPSAGQPLIAGATSNLWVPPSVAHAEDDEFESSTLDPAWTAYYGWTPSLATVSYGTINAYDTGFTSGTTLRVNLGAPRPSWLLTQQPVGGSTTFFDIAKPYTFPTNVLIWARMKFNHDLTIINDDSCIGLTVYQDSGGLINKVQTIELFLNESDAGTVQAKVWRRLGGGATGAVVSTDVDAQGQALEYVALHKVGTTFHVWVGTASGNWIWLTSYSDSRTFAHVGFFMSMASFTRPGPHISGVDFIRFVETDNFLL